MSLDAVKILGISVTVNSKNDILEFIRKSLTNGAEKPEKLRKNAVFDKKILTIVTPNPEQIVYAGRDSHFREILNRADLAIPDGIGVVWAGRVLRKTGDKRQETSIQNVIPGIEFMENLVEIAAKQRVGIALIGGRSGLALTALECLQKKHPGLAGWAVDGPEVRVISDRVQVTSENTEKYFQVLAKRIVDSGVRMVFVGLGAPKQEYFIEKLCSHCEPRTVKPIVFMSVGGAFDEIAGRVPRAPRWVSQSGLKWLWRLILEPRRIKRQLALIQFVKLVLQERYRLK